MSKALGCGGWLVAATLLTGVLAGDAMAADYDNPTISETSTPCVVLERYRVERSRDGNGEWRYAMNARIGNLCPRAVEVSFCQLALATDAVAEEQCETLAIRPNDHRILVRTNLASRIVSPSLQWRYRGM